MGVKKNVENHVKHIG